jgi:vibriolysin
MTMISKDPEVAMADVQFEVVDMGDDGVPNFLVGKIGHVRVDVGATQVDVERVMFPALEKAAPLMRMQPSELALTNAMTDKEGDQHFRFQQYKNGLPVFGGKL